MVQLIPLHLEGIWKVVEINLKPVQNFKRSEIVENETITFFLISSGWESRRPTRYPQKLEEAN